MFKNRIEKNFKKLRPWAERAKIDAYRLYDRDIPEFPYIVDKYLDYYLIHDKSDPLIDLEKESLPKVVSAIEQLFSPGKDRIVIKERRRKEGLLQYERMSDSKFFFKIQETQAHFLINLHDYLDTGLFLDHRPLRQSIFKKAKGKSLLNLFCYTGSMSVFAALGGATTTSIDMSKTYLDWAKENFKLNHLDPEKHTFINENVMEYLKSPPKTDLFDIIFLDPPTFSNSKKMDSDFDVENDHIFLLNTCMNRLKENGVLYFSTNKRKFKIDPTMQERYLVKDISKETIPVDFHDQKIHSCFEIRKKS